MGGGELTVLVPAISVGRTFGVSPIGGTGRMPDDLTCEWAFERWPMAAQEVVSPGLPRRIAFRVVEAAPGGAVALEGSAIPGNVLVAEGEAGALGGGAVVASVLLGAGGIGTLNAAGVADDAIDLGRAAGGSADLAGAALPGSVVLARGSAGSLGSGGDASPPAVDLAQGGAGGAEAAGDAAAAVDRHPAAGEAGHRLRARLFCPPGVRFAHPRARVRVLGEA
jgi:hypothetical protein